MESPQYLTIPEYTGSAPSQALKETDSVMSDRATLTGGIRGVSMRDLLSRTRRCTPDSTVLVRYLHPSVSGTHASVWTMGLQHYLHNPSRVNDSRPGPASPFSTPNFYPCPSRCQAARTGFRPCPTCSPRMPPDDRRHRLAASDGLRSCRGRRRPRCPGSYQPPMSLA